MPRPRSRTKPDPFLIREPRQVRALASPVRQEVLDVLMHAGALPAGEIAERMGVAPDGLYFHLRLLERVGLVRRAGSTGAGRREAALWDVPGRPMVLDYEHGSSTASSRVRRLSPPLDAILRLTRRDVRRALARDQASFSGPRRDVWVARFRGKVSPSELEEINALLAQAAEIVRGARGGPGSRSVALTFALLPTVESRADRTPRTRKKS
ncbi:MAG: helix-turn-helix domain-containing protein [Phycisphaerales bacterium]|jgi:DNA-binding transcriptional ArsR family regulator|nr:helix-turn-helix domain-containing protein [Phycisphaerales bacterium]